MSEIKKKKKCKIIVKEKTRKIVEEKKESELDLIIEDLRETTDLLDVNFDKIVEHINRNKGKKAIEPPPYSD